jgi:hypothetical protein
MLLVPITEALGIVSFFLGFFIVVPWTVGLLCSTAFLVFFDGLLEFSIVASSSCSFHFSPFIPTTGTFH